MIFIPKRAPRGDGSVRERPDGRWEARVSLGYHPGTGKPIRKSIYGDTQKEVLKKKRELLQAVDEGTYTYVEPSKMTVTEWLDTWISDFSSDKKFLTLKHYKVQCETHIKPAIGATKLSALTTPMIQKMYNSLENKKDEGKSLSPKSVKNIHGILHKAFSVAVQVGYLKQNPADAVTLPKVIKKEIQPLTDEQVSAFVKVADEDDFAVLFKVILFTGPRKGEALGLTWDCLNYDTDIVTFNKQLQERPIADGGAVLAPLKNNKTRRLKVAPFVMEWFKAHEEEQKKMHQKAGSAWQGWQDEEERQTAFVFTNELGQPLLHRTVSKRFKKIAAKIGAPDTRVHDLRHTYAVISLQSGDDHKTVQENLGHHTAAFTLDIYGHVSEQMKKASADRMQEYIKNNVQENVQVHKG